MTSIYTIDPGLLKVAQSKSLASICSVEQVQANFVRSMQAAHRGVLSLDVNSLESTASEPPDDPLRPVLRAPAPSAREAGAPRANSRAQMGLMLVKVQDIVSSQQLDEIKASLDVWNQSAKAQQQHLDQLGEDYLAAMQDLDDANQQLNLAIQGSKQAREALAAAEQALQEAQQALAQLDESDPDFAATQAALIEAQKQQTEAARNLSVANGKTGAATALANQAQAKADALMAQLPPELQEELQQKELQSKGYSSATMLSLLMAEMNDLVAEGAEEELRSQMEINRVRNEAVQNDQKARAKELDDKNKKQAEMNKGVNCAMKILGALVMVVSVVGAVFSGGASLALAAVGVGLFLVDKIVEKATGTSLTARVMQPLMNHVLKPLADALSKGVSSVLQAFGMDKDKAERAGAIIGTVVSAAAMVAMMVAAAVLTKKVMVNAIPAIAKMAGSTISRMAPQVLKTLGSRIGASMTQVGTRTVAQMSQASSRVAAQIGRVADQAATQVSRAGQSVGKQIERAGQQITRKIEMVGQKHLSAQTMEKLASAGAAVSKAQQAAQQKMLEAGTQVLMALNRVRNSSGGLERLGNRLEQGGTVLYAAHGVTRSVQSILNGKMDISKSELMFILEKLEALYKIISDSMLSNLESYKNKLAILLAMLVPALEAQQEEANTLLYVSQNIAASAQPV